MSVSVPAAIPTYAVNGADPAPWQKIFGAVGLKQAQSADAQIVVLGSGAKSENAEALARNHIVVLETRIPAGAKTLNTSASVRRIVDIHNPDVQIVWKETAEAPNATMPADFRVFAYEKWKNIPLLAGKRTEAGALLWMATPPGQAGFERYPYLIQALTDLGMKLPVRSTTLWAFFDSSYRLRADPDYLAKRWREAGISVLHVAAWHNMEPEAANDEFLKKVIAACHRNAILVYAWLELPHVSEKFWAEHPDWREKTALGQDAQLDWRKLMNLNNPQCRKAVAEAVSALLDRFDWDGVNLAELYFESLEGAANPARFTPMNENVRAEFRTLAGFDPQLIFDPQSPRYSGKDPAALREFLDFRAVLAARMQSDWLDEIEQSRRKKPFLGVVLTHIDDRFDAAIRDALGADVARTLPLIKSTKSTLLVEDPANLWDLGPERYTKLGAKYRELTPDVNALSVDINVVERYQDVYPTKKQTGLELFELVHEAAHSFGHVAIYFENSVEKQDLALLGAAGETAEASNEGAGMEITGEHSTRVMTDGPVMLDGRRWPVQGTHSVLVPAGKHRIFAGAAPPIAIEDFNGEIRSAFARDTESDISYVSQTRAVAVIGSAVTGVRVDGLPFAGPMAAGEAIMLPAGEHVAEFKRSPSENTAN